MIQLDCRSRTKKFDSDSPVLLEIRLHSKTSYSLRIRLRNPAVNHVVLERPIHRPSHGLHGRTVLEYETIEWLLNTWPEI